MSFDLYQFLQFPIWIRSPTEHLEEMRDAYDRVKLDLCSLAERVYELNLTIASEGGDVIARGKNEDDVEWRTVALARVKGTKLYRLRAQFKLGGIQFLIIAIFLNAVFRAVEDPFD